MHQKGFTNAILVVVIILLMGAVGYLAFVKTSPDIAQQTNTLTPANNPINTPPSPTTTPTPTQTKITILVPDNAAAYDKAVTDYMQVGGQDPLKNWPFVTKELRVPFTTDTVRASAEAAAKELAPYGGSANASIAYLKVHNGTAYVLLNIDLDGWAGVSVSLGRIHPLVEKTLLQFSQITRVVFGFAPGDNRENAL